MNIDEIILEMRENAGLIVERGSVVYGCTSSMSDRDILAIVPDRYEEFLSQHENGILRQNDLDTKFLSKDEDWEYISESNFHKQVEECTVLGMETICTPSKHVIYYNSTIHDHNIKLPLDKWKIRQRFSATASNSWAKAHKKMTVEKDLDIYRGQKSLFHSLRILMFANQLCEYGWIVNFEEANDYWWKIYSKRLTWDEYKAEYKPIYNELRSKLARLAPKPID